MAYITKNVRVPENYIMELSPNDQKQAEYQFRLLCEYLEENITVNTIEKETDFIINIFGEETEIYKFEKRIESFRNKYNIS